MRRHKKGRRYNILQRVGIAMMLAGAGLWVLSVDPYAAGYIGTAEFLARTTWGLMLGASGWLLWRPWTYEHRREEEDRWLE